MLQMIKRLLGEDIKKIRGSIILLTVDTFFNMFFYGMLFATLLELMNRTLTVERITLFTLIMVVAFFGRLILNIFGYQGVQIGGARSVEKLRIKLGDHIRNLNLGFFNKNSIGSLSNIMLGDVSDFEQILTHNTSDLIKTSFTSIYLMIVAYFINVELALILTAFILIAMPIILLGGRKVNQAGELKKKSINQVISRIVEYLSGMQVFKAYNLTGERFKRLEKALSNFKKESIRTEIAIVPYVLIFQIIVDISFPIVLIFTTLKFGSGEISKVDFLTFTILNMALTNVIRAFAAQYGSFRYMKLSSQKLINTFEQPVMTYTKEDVILPHYDIEFDHVKFSYEKDVAVLKDVSFTAKTGTMTALIGPSGSGKTTVTSLVARFWDIDEGVIRIGGHDIKTVNPDAMLKHISMVFQDVYLLNDTIYNNIKIGNPNATYEKVVEAAKAANCHEFIDKLEAKYETMIGESGSTLSGGEKQRISIARALLKNAPIILLDEATASLDADNEFEIKKAIQKLTKDRTVIVIAHRLNTIVDADQIVLLNNGGIEEIGNHKDLLARKQHYYNMYTEMNRAKAWAI
ncbi:ABC transporter ATP-binding protein [Fusibacter bizertensis]